MVRDPEDAPDPFCASLVLGSFGLLVLAAGPVSIALGNLPVGIICLLMGGIIAITAGATLAHIRWSKQNQTAGATSSKGAPALQIGAGLSLEDTTGDADWSLSQHVGKLVFGRFL